MKICIVCPIHNEYQHTQKFLEEIYGIFRKSACEEAFHVVIVDDGSTDGISDWIARHYPRATVLKGDGNLWWAGAMNVGAEWAVKNGMDYVFVLNNDNLFERDYFTRICQPVQEGEKGIIGSLIKNIHDKSVWSAGGYLDTERGRFGMYTAVPESVPAVYPVDWLTGMGTLIHRSVFEKIGYWDNGDFPQYYADADFTLRAKSSGIPVYLNQEWVLWNDTAKTGMNSHQGRVGRLYRSLVSVRSHYHIPTTLKFLARHGMSGMALMKTLWTKYGRYIGGFIKGKLSGQREHHK